MSTTLPRGSAAPVDDLEELLTETAHLRARGLTWEAVARDLDTDPADLRRRARSAGNAYRALARDARREVADEACAEALVTLRRELRSDDKGRRTAADSILRFRMTYVRHRRHAPAAPKKASPMETVPLSRREDAEQLVAFLEQHSDEELAKLAREMYPPAATAGAPPRAGSRVM